MMTRAERERLIELYFDGKMSPGEEQDFFIQVAMDKELRRELKAHRAIDSAMRKEREAEPTEHTQLRSRVAATLAASGTSGSGQLQPAGGKSLAFRRWFGTLAGTAILGIVIILMLPSNEVAENAGSDVPTQVTRQQPGMQNSTTPDRAALETAPRVNQTEGIEEPNISERPLVQSNHARRAEAFEQETAPNQTQPTSRMQSPSTETEIHSIESSAAATTFSDTVQESQRSASYITPDTENPMDIVSRDSARGSNRLWPLLMPIEWPPSVTSEEDDSISVGIKLNIELPN